MNRLHFAGNDISAARQAASPAGIPPKYLPKAGVDPLAHAFDRKTGVHPGLHEKPLSGPEAASALRELRSLPRAGQSAAYVHLPFCETHCLYCGFFGGRYTEEKGDAYLDALLAQLDSEKETPAFRSGPIHALYFGGGTPTALTVKQLERLLGAFLAALPLAPDCEITVEGRIHNFTDEKMRACIDAGVNRFSLGVQSFDTSLRRQLGRLDDRETVMRRIEALAAFDRAAIVADLIYGLPGQDMARWEADLDLFLRLPLDGVDLYQLNVFPGGGLHTAIEKGAIPPAADIPAQSLFFKRGIERMTQAGMRRLSMSHWGKTPRERNVYNPLTKSRADCLAFGSGAGGTLRGGFYFMESDPDTYRQRIAAGELPVAMLAPPPAGFALMRVLLGQMELGFLELAAVEKAAGMDARERLETLLAAWQEGGLVTVQDGRAVLTTAGQFWQVNLTQLLLSWLLTPATSKG